VDDRAGLSGPANGMSLQITRQLLQEMIAGANFSSDWILNSLIVESHLRTSNGSKVPLCENLTHLAAKCAEKRHVRA
jgi:hypothetical protein